MTDFFAALGLPRNAWLDSDEVKSRYHQCIAAAHPDKPGGDTSQATLLNEARRVLESPPERLRHLVTLLAPDFSAEEKARPDWELFSNTGEAAREAAALADKLAVTPAPIVRAGLLAQAKTCQRRLETLKSCVEEQKRSLETQTHGLTLDPFDAATAWRLAEEWTFLERLTATLHKAVTALKTA